MDRLDSWKEIAAYLNRDVTTVQRWEKREAMPVHRHQHDRMGSVYAFRTELDAWVRRRSQSASPEPETAGSPTAPGSWWGLGLRAPAPEHRRPGTDCRRGGRGWRLARSMWLRATEFFWRSPIADARFQRVTDFDAVEQAAAVSRDGRLVAFLSDRDGRMDVWITQVGSGPFHNLTRGERPGARQSFSPPRWASRPTARWSRSGSAGRMARTAGAIGIWAVPTLGGQPRPLPRRRRRGRLVPRRSPARVPHAGPRGSDVRDRRRPAVRGHSHLHGSLPGSTLTFRCGRPTAGPSTS